MGTEGAERAGNASLHLEQLGSILAPSALAPQPEGCPLSSPPASGAPQDPPGRCLWLGETQRCQR